jgi:hypothetical protein
VQFSMLLVADEEARLFDVGALWPWSALELHDLTFITRESCTA